MKALMALLQGFDPQRAAALAARGRKPAPVAQLAQTIDISRNTLYRWASGDSLPNSVGKIKLALYLRCTTDDVSRYLDDEISFDQFLALEPEFVPLPSVSTSRAGAPSPPMIDSGYSMTLTRILRLLPQLTQEECLVLLSALTQQIQQNHQQP